MLIDFLSVLSDADTDLLLAINGWRAEWADYFMYAFSGKLVWIPMYAAMAVMGILISGCRGLTLKN